MIHWLKAGIRKTRSKRKISHVNGSVHPALDVGCGPFPIYDADFASDLEFKLFDLPEMERKLAGRFVQCEIYHLPFASRSFAFVHSSNVLEHTENPERAFLELKRVGRHGFVETPSDFFEKVINHSPRHRWIVRWEDGRVVADNNSGLFNTNVYLFSPLTWWIRIRLPLLWKAIMVVLDLGLDLAYNKYYW